MPLENLPKKRGPDWATGSIMLMLAIAAIVFYDLPKFSSMRANRSAVQDLQNQLSVLNQQRSDVNNAISQIDKNQSTLQQVDLAIPDKPQLADIFAHLEVLAKSSNMTLSSVQADDPTLQPSTDNPAAAAQAQAQADQAQANQTNKSPSPTIGLVPVRIELRGTITSLQSFLAALEQSLRLIDVQQINIIQGDNSSLTFDIDLNTYYQKK